MRLPDWPARLEAYLLSRRDMPFAWGANDCAMHAAGAYEAVTGAKPGDWSYDTATGAARLLRAPGGLAGLVDGIGLPRRPATDLRRGDIGLMKVDGRDFLAVIWGEFAISPGDEHALMNRTLDCEFGWAVD